MQVPSGPVSHSAAGSGRYSWPDSLTTSTRGASGVELQHGRDAMGEQIDRVAGAENRGDVAEEQRRARDVGVAGVLHGRGAYARWTSSRCLLIHHS